MDSFMLEKIYDSFLIPIYVVKDGEKGISIPSLTQYPSPFEQDRKLCDEMAAIAKKKDKPFLYLENNNIYYGVFKDNEEYYYFFGPMARKTVSGSEANAYRHTHRVQLRFLIEKCGFGMASKMLAMAFFYYSGEKISYQEVEIEGREDVVKKWNPEEEMEWYQLEQSEEERGHNSIEYENYVMQLVKKGNVEAMKVLMNEDRIDMDDVGVLAVDTLKQTEYMMVTFVALVTRAAIEGGLNPERAYELGDIYLQQIERCKTAAEIGMVGMRAQIDFTERVRDAKESRSKLFYIEGCKDYIARHLRKPFKVGDIAPAIGINRTYLAKKFTEVEGMTIQQYVMQERCKHAANLLKYSDYPISLISEYFCFSSQSHFGVQFKKIYGMTPNEYRNENRYIESYKK